MAQLAQEMIKDALDAFSKKDPALAQAVLVKDKEQNDLKSKAVNEIIALIAKHPDQVRQFIDLILIAKNLEKVGDHATNIAEDVIFMVSGKDIRHPAQPNP
jgi:phosphate transport system protein